MPGILDDISIVIPVLNDAPALETTLATVPEGPEVVVVDGGSHDDSVAVARRYRARVVSSDRGRGRQMNEGARLSTRPTIVFLHADTRLPPDFAEAMSAFARSGREWGRFDVRLSGGNHMFRVIEFMMNWRSRLTGICTGDQAIFVTRAAFERTGGLSIQPLMEDIEFSRRMRRRTMPYCTPVRIETSSRRWEHRGIWSTILLMWQLRLMYFVGVDAERLAGRYR